MNYKIYIRQKYKFLNRIGVLFEVHLYIIISIYNLYIKNISIFKNDFIKIANQYKHFRHLIFKSDKK